MRVLDMILKFKPVLAAYLFLGSPAMFFVSFVPLLGIHFCFFIIILSFYHKLQLPKLDSPQQKQMVDNILGPQGVNCGKIAHRGGALDAPENSIFAVEKAKSEGGAVCIEFDVSFTRDLVPVIFHDDSIDRVTDQSGRISKMKYCNVKELNLASKRQSTWKYTSDMPAFVGIPTLDEMVETCLDNELSMIIDLKTWRTPLQTTQTILSLFQKHPNLSEKVIVSSFFPHLIYLIRSQNPTIMCSLAFRPNFISSSSYDANNPNILTPRKNLPWPSWLPFISRVLDYLHHILVMETSFIPSILGLTAILLHKDCISESVIHEWQVSRNIRVVGWTVNDVHEKDYFQKYLKCDFMSDTMSD